MLRFWLLLSLLFIFGPRAVASAQGVGTGVLCAGLVCAGPTEGDSKAVVFPLAAPREELRVSARRLVEVDPSGRIVRQVDLRDLMPAFVVTRIVDPLLCPTGCVTVGLGWDFFLETGVGEFERVSVHLIAEASSELGAPFASHLLALPFAIRHWPFQSSANSLAFDVRLQGKGPARELETTLGRIVSSPSFTTGGEPGCYLSFPILILLDDHAETIDVQLIPGGNHVTIRHILPAFLREVLFC